MVITALLTHRRSGVAALNGAGVAAVAAAAAAAIAGARLNIDGSGGRKEGHGRDGENESAREHHHDASEDVCFGSERRVTELEWFDLVKVARLRRPLLYPSKAERPLFQCPV